MLCTSILALCACHPAPSPVTPVDGTPCERLCARVVELRCSERPASECAATCERYEAEADYAPVLSWRPECGAKQSTCADIERCRRGEL